MVVLHAESPCVCMQESCPQPASCQVQGTPLQRRILMTCSNISGFPSRIDLSFQGFPWISMHHWRRPRRAGPTSGATGAVWAVANGAHQRRRNLWAAPARRPPARAVWRLTSKDVVEQGKSAAPCAGGCNATKGLTIMLCPAQTKKTPEIA